MPTPADTDPVELLARHRERIRRLIARLVAPHDADDVEQEVYVAALERPPRNAAALPSWIATTVRNLMAKSWRKRDRRRARESAAARPEPQPATADLVARVELEEFLLRCVRELAEPEREVVLLRFFEGLSAGEVATRLHIGASTERARTARALAQLRERLDARCAGDRSEWIAALAPPLVVGASVMSAKVAAAAGISLAVVLGGLGWKLAHDRAPARRDAPGVARVAAATAADPAGAVGVAPETAAAGARRLEEPAPSPSPAAAPVPAQPPSGELKLRVVDAQTDLPLEKIKLRALNDARYAVWKGDRDADVRLTAGTWELAVEVEGYEPELRSAVAIRADSATDLGIVALERGTAVLYGTLRRAGVPADARAFVELRGDGRSPCPQCRPPYAALDADGEATQFPATKCCGYFWDRSFLEVGAEGRFEFRGLATGTYFLRPMDAVPRAQPTLRVTVTRGEQRRVEINLGEEAGLVLNLTDARGHPFSGRWKEDGSEQPEVIHFTIDVDGVEISCDAVPDADLLRNTLGAPRRFDAMHERTYAAEMERMEAGLRNDEVLDRWVRDAETSGPPCTDPEGAARVEALPIDPSQRAELQKLMSGIVSGGRPRSDRERAKNDVLLPEPPTPGFGWLEIAMAQLGPAAYRVSYLPASRVKARARCAGSFAMPVEVDLADPARRAVTLVFR